MWAKAIHRRLFHYNTPVCCHSQGIISYASLVKAAELRKMGAAFVIVSGARTSTVLQRLPYLPAADAILAENGNLLDTHQLQKHSKRQACVAACDDHQAIR